MLQQECKLITNIESIETILPPCLDKALLFEGKKVKERKGCKTWWSHQVRCRVHRGYATS